MRSEHDAGIPGRTHPAGSRPLRRPLSPTRRKLRAGLPPTLQRQKGSQSAFGEVAGSRTPIANIAGAGVQDLRNTGRSPCQDQVAAPLCVDEPLCSEALPKSIKKNTAQLKGGPAIVVPIASAAIDANLFVLRGDYWELRYKATATLIEDGRGLRYVALLLQHAAAAEGPLHATELVALATGSRNGPVELSIKDPVLDSVAEQQMIKRLEEIAFRRSAAEGRGDYESVARFDEEADEITDAIAKMHRPHRSGGRRATFSDAGEKARKAVSKAIKETISKLSALPQMQELAEHFSKTIRKGQWLSYTGGLAWEVDFHPTQSEKKSPLRRAK